MDQWIINAPRWLLLAALIYAPWAYGSTRPWTVTGLNWILGTTIGLWLISHLFQQRWPKVNRVQLLATAFLIGLAWFMVFNARYEYDQSSLEFLARSQAFAFAPGSLDRDLSFDSAIRCTLMLMVGLVAFEVAESSRWRKRILGTMILVGCSIVGLGLAQRFTGATGIFWAREDLGPNFFATFRNHTNAGAYLNLIWPLAVGFAVREKLATGLTWRFVVWTALAVICLTGVMVNTSRAANSLAAGLLLLTGIWLIWQAVKGRFGDISPASIAAATVLLVIVIGTLAFMTGLDSNLGRWRQFDKQLTEDNSRLLAARACLKMIPESGWWGFGPGTFESAFPYFTAEFGNQLRGRWIFAHQDYLQTLIEWGYVGGAMWAIAIFGGIIRSVVRGFRYRRRLSTETRITHFALLVSASGVLLHALVDFPLQIASIQLYVIVLIGMLWSSHHWIQSAHQQNRARPQRREAQVESLNCAA